MRALVPIFRRLSPSGRGARLSILIFHRVLPAADPLFPELPDATRFDEMLSWIKSWFNVLPLSRAVEQLSAGTLPDRAAAITFDDGYADNRSVALPLLRRHGLSATFFIATGFLDGGRMWNDTIIEAIRGCGHRSLDLGALGLGQYSLADAKERRAAIDGCIARVKYLPIEQRTSLSEQAAARAGVVPPSTLMMTSDDVVAMRRAGMQIGAHTITHPILARLAPAEARHEIEGSKTFLQDLLGERVGLFAYPNGRLGEDYVDEHARMASDIGFDAAVSTNAGVADARSDLMQLPRFTPWDRTRLRFGARLLMNLKQASAAIA